MTNIIAEIGTSHSGSYQKAVRLVDAACDAGADTIKFQWVYADEILHPKTGFVALPTGNIPLYERFRQLECPPQFYKDILDYVHSKGRKFCCSPFGLRSLRELLDLDVDFVKIASPELNHIKMLGYLRAFRDSQAESGRSRVPVILSSGVSKLSDIDLALEIVGRENVSLLHCVTSYPAPEDEYNLRLVSTLRAVLGIETGVSDHSLDPVLVPVLSAVCGGTVIEKHFTLSRQTDGLDDPVALEPEQFALMVHAVRQSEAAVRHYGMEEGMRRIIDQLSEQFGRERVSTVLGDGIKRLAPAESANYGRTNRSLHFMRDMRKGETITGDDIGILRTEKILTPGIHPRFFDEIVGARLSSDVEAGQGVRLGDVIQRI